MASSSVSQDDIDNDFELNSRRTRIRTARARQINPNNPPKEAVPSTNPSGATPSRQEAAPPVESSHLDHEHHHHHMHTQHYHHHHHLTHDDTSPKALPRSGPALSQGGASNQPKDKRPPKGHVHLKGKPARDRRKLREKRRSTGVVHLASTESAGGSTTGDDEESSDALVVGGVCAEVKAPPTAPCAPPVSAPVKPRRPSNVDDDDDTESARDSSPGRKCLQALPASIRSRPPRNKSPSDLEADDENDVDSLNQSSAATSSNNLETLSLNTKSGNGLGHTRTNSNTPVYRPTTPTGQFVDQHSDQIERVVEENRRLLSLMEEKDKKIHLLEYQIQELMKRS
ncbi:protein hunchback-like [Tigriopus californicus]|uniref:protein hunchback-like n=1 Tax=Tigriopus californicus TaxID=6832 RepID=UPI0027D9FF4C|nr:protein hunchback-like [Tigriopus californicus]